ncbi:olfactory receptor 1M1-like [Hyperolius riggenbachi]|uniref:olfactory receptor 1M1-like n=1 Tax=Hyperolius riggenbachi TaxID=752182 RepID=UPI0035A29376
MYKRNVTTVVLLGFHTMEKFNLWIFTILLITSFVAICGNLLIIFLVSISKTLHSPMYFFLTQLSLADIVLTTNISPNMLSVVLHKGVSISFPSCIAQLYFFGLSEISECLILTVMSYDRYLAICSPLHYASIMSHVLCVKLVLASWLLSSLVALILTLGVCQLQFCGPNTVDHFFCDLNPLLDLSCSDASIIKLELTLLCVPVLVLPFFVVVVSYVCIVVTVMQISSISGLQKSMSTCSSHLTVVCLFYGTIFVMYVIPNKGKSQETSKTIAMLYTVFTPFLNPFIYSLRNKDIKEALRKTAHKCITLQNNKKAFPLS